MNKNQFYETSIKGSNRFFCLSESVDERVCDGCDKIINDPVAIFCYSLSKTFRHFGIYHFVCKDKVPSKVVYQEKGVFTFIDERLPNSSMVIFGSKTVKDTKSNLTVFEASSIPSEVVNDKTIFSGRESLEGASIGLLPGEVVETPEDFLDQVKDSVPLIDKSKDSIEYKRVQE